MTLGAAASLRLDAARLRYANGSLVGPLSLSTSAERVALVGDFGALFRLLSNRATLESGSVTLLDLPSDAALSTGVAAVVPLDLPLPAAWTCERYLGESAGLLGLARSAARERAHAALARFELGAFARRTLGSLAVHDRRALGIVRATLSDPKLILCEAPLAGLPTSAQRLLSMALERTGCALVVSFHEVPRFGLEHALFESCGEYFVHELGALRRFELDELEAAPSLSVMVAENADAFERELALRDVSATRIGQVDLAYAFVYGERQTGCVRFTVQAPDAFARRKLLEASVAASATLLEIRPT